jgi:hypothetical protein
MNSIIIYPNDNGSVAFCYPAHDCGLSIQEIACKDVPVGKPYLIVPNEQVPTDHTFFEAFEADFSNPDGYGIGYDAWFALQLNQEVTLNDND